PLVGHAATVKPSAPSSYVVDLDANVVRAAERAEIVRPIASLTKLMTAMVLLDAHADLGRTVAYDPKRHYAYRNWMWFRTGDRLTGRDLLLTTLVGSQNITARMLADVARIPESTVVARMNAKAQSLGLVQTRFVDVHGLSPKNISTAGEVARMFEVALTYPDIADVLGRGSARVTITPKRGKARTALFSHTNVLLKRTQRFATEASKTGYLDEAGDALAMRVRDPKSGHRFIVVTLGEPRRNPRFSIAKRLAEAAVHTQQIARVR
ncbi:D-alanyl-D-alanine carboxypeptidase, partial [Candidatus Uhrbacteria bacterium]|nr:D-alanyl-D-alanine carboxypeptidase [Candidatus Uhrbacteria bacterium]